MRQRGSGREARGGGAGARGRHASLLPTGEPVESLLRKAQFFTPGDRPKITASCTGGAGEGPRSSTGSGGGMTGRCVPPTG